MSLLLSVPRDLVTQGIVKAEVLDIICISVSTRNSGLLQFQALDTTGEMWNKKMRSWRKMIRPGNTVVLVGTPVQRLRDRSVPFLGYS